MRGIDAISHKGATDVVLEGSIWRAGERDAGCELRAEPVDQTGSEAGDQRGRCDRKAVSCGAGGLSAGGAGGGGAAELAADGGAK